MRLHNFTSYFCIHNSTFYLPLPTKNFEAFLISPIRVFLCLKLHLLSVAQSRTMSRLCALFKAYSVETGWKATRDRFRRPSYLSRVDHVRKIRDRKHRTDIGKCSFVNRTTKNWNQLQVPTVALGTSPCKPKIFRNRVRKTIINRVK